MAIEHRDFTISVWIDDDTSHAKMLRGEKGSERLYCDVDPVRGSQQTRSKRFILWSIEGLGLPGDDSEKLQAAARWWIDAPDDFEEAQNAAGILRKLRVAQQSREQKSA